MSIEKECVRCDPHRRFPAEPEKAWLCPNCRMCVVCSEDIDVMDFAAGGVLAEIARHCVCHGCSACAKCWKSTATSNVLAGQIDRLQTMSCGIEVGEEIMRMLLAPELYSKVLEWRLKRVLESMPGVRSCPGCEATFDFAMECPQGSRPCRDVGCGACGMRFCFDCHEPVVVSFTDSEKSHLGLTCAEFERVRDGESVEDVISGAEAPAKRWTVRSCLETFTKPCVGCSRRIEKNGGCNWVTCMSCENGGFSFCWMCRATQEDNAPHVTCYEASQRELQLIAEILAIPEHDFAEHVPAKLAEFKAFLADFPAKEAEAVAQHAKASMERAERMERQRLERIAAENALPEGVSFDLFESETDVTIVYPAPQTEIERRLAEVRARVEARERRRAAQRAAQRAEAEARGRRRQRQLREQDSLVIDVFASANDVAVEQLRPADAMEVAVAEEELAFDLFGDAADVAVEGVSPAPEAQERSRTPTLINMLFVPRRPEDPMWAMNSVPSYQEGVLDDIFHSFSSPALMAMA